MLQMNNTLDPTVQMLTNNRTLGKKVTQKEIV